MALRLRGSPRLIGPSFPFTATFGGGWTPASLGSALKAWYKADTGVTTSGGYVTEVLDQSGNGFTLTPVVLAGSGVPFNATGFNGLPAFDFDASAAGLYTDSGNPNQAFTGWNGVSSCSVFAAAQATTGISANARLFTTSFGTSDDFADDRSIVLVKGTGAFLYVYRNGVQADSPTITLDAPSRFGFICDGAGSSQTAFYNNTAGTPFTVSKSFGSPLTLGMGMVLSAGVPANSNKWHGPVAELVVTNTALSSEDRNSLDAYFVSKYGL